MGKLDNFSDMTGKMSQVDVNAQNIQNIINELNRSADQVDALSNSISIINRNNVTIPLVGSNYNATVNIATGVPSSFLAYMSRSDNPGQYWTLPYFATTGVPVSALQMAVFAQLQQSGNQVNLVIQGVVGSGYAAPASITVYYYILSQPANASGQ